MLEAYEIGISLALQDGVSSGIALIRRDLDALDRAIAATSQNLARLQTRAGQPTAPARIALPSPGPLPQHAPPPDPAPAPATPASPTPRLPEAPLATNTAALTPTIPPPTPSRTQAQAGSPPFNLSINQPGSPPQLIPTIQRASPAATPAPPATTPAPPATSPATIGPVATAAPQPRAPLQAVRAPALVATAPSAPPLARPSPPGPLASPGPIRLQPAPQTPASRPLAPLQTVARAHRTPAAARDNHPVRSAAFASRLPPPASYAAAAPTGSPPAAPLQPAPTRPSAPPQPNAPAPNQPIQPPQAPASFAPPPIPSQPAITLAGDIVLDGARVGRWMTSTLARQAARPPAGPTGPDPRQTPLWSGQAQGF